MSKSFIYNLILTVVAIVVFIFIGASVYDAFTRNPVNRTAEDSGASSVSGQIEAATPDATQPAQPTAASDAPPVVQDQQQAEAAYEQTNDPASPSATQNSANSGSASGSASGNESGAVSAPQQATPAPAPAPTTATSPRPGTSTNTAQNSTTEPNAPASSPGTASPAKPAVRSNPDLRAVIPPVPTAPPRAEGVPPPNTTSQDMYNATNSGMDNGNISDSFPAPVSNFPAPVSPGATSNTPGVNNDEQRRLQELRNQKEQLRRDLGF